MKEITNVWTALLFDNFGRVSVLEILLQRNSYVLPLAEHQIRKVSNLLASRSYNRHSDNEGYIHNRPCYILILNYKYSIARVRQFIVLFIRRIGQMNRSVSSSFKSSSFKKSKQMAFNKSSVGFKTILKSRGTNTIIDTITKSSRIKNIPESITKPDDNSGRGQEDMKQFVKSIKKEVHSHELINNPHKKQLISDKIEGWTHRNEHQKCQSQPKLLSSKKVVEEGCGISSVNLQILEKKTEQLLLQKLLKKSHSKSFLSLRVYQDKLEKQLQSLIEEIQNYRIMTESDNQLVIDNQIKELAQKIGILEKIIAESFTESEMLKKYYFLNKINKKPSNLFNHPIRAHLSKKSAICKNSSFVAQHPSLHFSTISQTSYSKPHKEAYEKKQRNLWTYVPNRQGVGKSSYQVDFLNYGGLPTYPGMKGMQNPGVSQNIKQEKHSVYQSDFKPKRTQIVNSKQLDCRRDKFQPTKITFMPKKMFSGKQNKNENQLSQIKKLSSKKIQGGNDRHYNLSYAQIYKQPSIMRYSGALSQSGVKSQYKEHFYGEKPLFDCIAKQTNLTNLKYQYKKNVHA